MGITQKIKPNLNWAFFLIVLELNLVPSIYNKPIYPYDLIKNFNVL